MEWKPGEHARSLGRKVDVARIAIAATAGLFGSELAMVINSDYRISVLTGVVVACAFDEARMSGKDG